MSRLNLAVAVHGTGSGALSWKWPGTQWNRFNDFAFYRRSAEIARSGVIDAVFVSDHPALSRDAHRAPTHVFDPTVLFAAIAGAVPDIGFVLTASSTYSAPYDLARKLASLDTISGGRVIWNVVANFNPDIAANFGSAPLPDRAERYRRADEFIEVVKKLWLSWDTPTGDVPDGPLWDETTARTIDHHGDLFDVRGPLNVPVGPQGHPVISQAGGSPRGIDLAARHAEIVYAAILSKAEADTYRRRLAERAVVHGRSGGDIRLLPGLGVVLGDTTAEAYRRQEALEGAGDEDALVAQLLTRLRKNNPLLPADVDADRPLRPEWFTSTDDQGRPIGFTQALHDVIAEEELTARRLVRRVGPAGGHRVVVGTPREVADDIIDWWSGGHVAGFNVHLPLLHEDLDRFVTQVVPILQAEGVYPTAYEEPTIRGRFGLPTPAPVSGGAALPDLAVG
ncbi:NtaA/DmoA family FMN-dependent monooxygenase [Gordonia pseudamarae]|uniref:NtaA/DmoA family FMN-dependent monooxygenase n=1 Tax=Gordonia pseudamarae TaxID=2831662 RepID=A0ABX6IEN9_9ACTN|nr:MULTISPECIES: NtaA/DmoA family FMN-dependent monooxygenase [Gordonia]MBD0021634.1 NtaA/DmoA family FMN-dependent monooxygenase [Gordonia sp. (in: high G+C Gram-positive bacteria)]QHN25381.1 NtaA/DmoA family FMN-dependent monooxygenase [Gordonia pseudamarae]QHN34312.1 NtaA/DmoA family FMN-dependent monooxygenase [Gordonia pseudamarae]